MTPKTGRFSQQRISLAQINPLSNKIHDHHWKVGGGGGEATFKSLTNNPVTFLKFFDHFFLCIKFSVTHFPFWSCPVLHVREVGEVWLVRTWLAAPAERTTVTWGKLCSGCCADGVPAFVGSSILACVSVTGKTTPSAERWTHDHRCK